MHANIVIKALAAHHIASDMNELTQERSRMHANIVIKALAAHHIASDMNELTRELRELSRTNARIVMSALVTHQPLSGMKKFIRMNASSLKKASVAHQTGRNIKKGTQ